MRDLEAAGKAEFQSFNPGNEGSHFFANDRSSRLDYIMVCTSGQAAAKSQTSTVIHWNRFIEDHRNLQRIIDEVSDHMPVISRFFFVDED